MASLKLEYQRPKFVHTSENKWKPGSEFSLGGCYTWDGTILWKDEDVRLRESYTHPLPRRFFNGNLYFEDAPYFNPNLTPKEIIQLGCYGGGYFRPIYSAVTGLKYDRMWDELPQNWLEGKHHRELVSSTKYLPELNRHNCTVGGSLSAWEHRGWMRAQDPYGWFQWYCRYYLGRRSPDDARQIRRWDNFCGSNGRWKYRVVREVERHRAKWDDETCVPQIRQILIHWAYKLTEEDYEYGVKNFPRKNELI